MSTSQPIELKWSLGLNKDIPGGVHNLGGSSIFYTVANTAVVYDHSSSEQRLLQGHVNLISATAVSGDRKYVITADTGLDSMLVVWDTETLSPVRTLFNPHDNGVLSVDISNDNQFIVTLSAPVPGQPQQLSIWSMYCTNVDEINKPLMTVRVEGQDIQTFVRFNPADVQELVTNGKRRVFFWTWESNGELPQFYSPALSARAFRQRVGDFTQTIFIPNSTQAATATVDGDVVLWDLSLVIDGCIIAKIIPFHLQAVPAGRAQGRKDCATVSGCCPERNARAVQL